MDYGVGNTFSVSNAIEFLGYRKLKISDEASVIGDADVLILPGVGAFDEAARNLRERRLDVILGEQVLVKKKPILGICVGMQLLATESEENGLHEGLNWIPGRIKKLDLPRAFAVPHVGWNNVSFKDPQSPLCWKGEESNFYFDHSYWFDCAEEHIAATCDYGMRLTAAVQKDHIAGIQFHPEKSQTSGLKLFRKFMNSVH